MPEQQYPEPTVGALIFDAQDRHFIFFDYACRTDSTSVILNHEAQEYIWIDLDRAEELPVEYYTAIAIREYRRMKSF